ncbi:glycosyltransferase family 4 protein [Nocardioides mesophilus]|uniref:Glycosyltransferase family 4 protein n=1 Tax=Nocardioides mesophilus TaxID=433659 RepID=A0A7G9RBQ9_9ACTN|nr:glycosyltransferase family 4 protein [Nocardioides mesophilus]QNN53034.1 glycosyltransferase family 4 protein [Nocardioides mesophilus]
MRLKSRTLRPDRRPRLLVLNWRDPWHPEGGGSELYVQQVCRRLAAGGVTVTMFTARYPGARRDEVREGIRYLRRGGHVTVYLWAALLLATRRLRGFDRVLEVQNGMPFLAGLFTRRPVVVLVHHVHREQWSILGPALARVGWFMESRVAVRINRGNRYVAVSEATREELAGLGVRAADVRVAYNGTPAMPSADVPGPDETPRVVVLSRLVPHKQIEHALDATARLVEAVPGLQLDVVGAGWWHDHLVADVQRLGLEERVTFHGHVTDEEKFQILSRAWVHLLPSVKEGWGLAIVEAATVGVPSLAYRSAGGVRESIQEGVTGLLADGYEDLVEQLRRLLTDEPLRSSLGEKARIRSGSFTWPATTASVRAALEI